MANENNQNQQNQTSELVVRREKLAALVEAGNNPFEITKYEVTHESASAIKEYTEKEEALLASGEEDVKVVFLDESTKNGDRIH